MFLALFVPEFFPKKMPPEAFAESLGGALVESGQFSNRYLFVLRPMIAHLEKLV